MMMTAPELIDAYVADVARLLPRKDRADVSMELRELLRDELGDGSADEALELLRGFGRPAEVAARYGKPLTVIDQGDTRPFLRLSVVGVIVIWSLGLIEAIEAGGGAMMVLQVWYFKYVLQSFWWPGLLVVCFGIAGWVRRRWPSSAAWKPKPSRTDHVNRAGRIAAIVFFVAGTLVLVNASWLIKKVTSAPDAIAAFSFDEEFLRVRGPLLLALIVLEIVHFAMVTVQGRWLPLTRKLELPMNLAMGAVMTWVVFAGSVYQSPPSDRLVKFVLVLTVAGILIDLAIKARRKYASRAKAINLVS